MLDVCVRRAELEQFAVDPGPGRCRRNHGHAVGRVPQLAAFRRAYSRCDSRKARTPSATCW